MAIPLTRGKVAIVDPEDAHLAGTRWQAQQSWGTWYATCAIRKTYTVLHRAVLGVTDPSILVDHINGDGLDCRRKNLRLASDSENQHNRRRNRRSTTGFKGVRSNKDGRWRAVIAGEYLGLFASPEDAARAYDSAARKRYGEFAALNFPQAGERAA